MQFTFPVGCATDIDITTTYDALALRTAALANHNPAHVTAPFIAALPHPDYVPGDPTPTFTAGDAVTFYGSTLGQEGGLQTATVTGPADGVDQDSNPVSGYLISVVEADDGGVAYNLFLPPLALQPAV